MKLGLTIERFLNNYFYIFFLVNKVTARMFEIKLCSIFYTSWTSRALIALQQQATA